MDTNTKHIVNDAVANILETEALRTEEWFQKKLAHAAGTQRGSRMSTGCTWVKAQKAEAIARRLNDLARKYRAFADNPTI